jgi:hypothetical protein
MSAKATPGLKPEGPEATNFSLFVRTNYSPLCSQTEKFASRAFFCSFYEIPFEPLPKRLR